MDTVWLKKLAVVSSLLFVFGAGLSLGNGLLLVTADDDKSDDPEKWIPEVIAWAAMASSTIPEVMIDLQCHKHQRFRPWIHGRYGQGATYKYFIPATVVHWLQTVVFLGATTLHGIADKRGASSDHYYGTWDDDNKSVLQNIYLLAAVWFTISAFLAVGATGSCLNEGCECNDRMDGCVPLANGLYLAVSAAMIIASCDIYCQYYCWFSLTTYITARIVFLLAGLAWLFRDLGLPDAYNRPRQTPQRTGPVLDLAQ